VPGTAPRGVPPATQAQAQQAAAVNFYKLSGKTYLSQHIYEVMRFMRINK
jgi:hypothetical protein